MMSPSTCRAGAKWRAEILLDRFGSLSAVLAAPHGEVIRALGPGSEVHAERLSNLQDLLICIFQSRVAERPVVASSAAVRAYLLMRLRHESREQLRVLYLDPASALILDELTGVGTVDHAPVYPREIVRRALELGAKYLLLVHNHPSGDPQASYADIQMTERIERAATVFEIGLVDHLIVGRNDLFSLRDNGWTSPRLPSLRPRDANKTAQTASSPTSNHARGRHLKIAISIYLRVYS